ncbi:hypothetical protein [Sphingomonas bacterium]|uniref:hypothetical protein n=1 Tax=Sphingomonas bacterium TaxID=1895847 RepID=UPI001576C524|nr:hypothetical protein [Sphingomonas bacterium]
MGVLRGVLILVGALAILMGLLWIGQGSGLVHWPASSFMLDQRPWAYRGLVLAGLGLMTVLIARRIGLRR